MKSPHIDHIDAKGGSDSLIRLRIRVSRNRHLRQSPHSLALKDFAAQVTRLSESLVIRPVNPMVKVPSNPFSRGSDSPLIRTSYATSPARSVAVAMPQEAVASRKYSDSRTCPLWGHRNDRSHLCIWSAARLKFPALRKNDLAPFRVHYNRLFTQRARRSPAPLTTSARRLISAASISRCLSFACRAYPPAPPLIFRRDLNQAEDGFIG